ncbi:MAG TPA: CRTAC1 family protein [Pirellulales bacterium]|nr:CRTAC1 family protein [Pirellulales bacterium]
MNSSPSSASTSALGLVVLVAVTGAAAGLAYLVLHWRERESHPSLPPPGFRDAARESGIDFQMHFLPAEQGETFRINLYDHGCGVAVADYDGDGHDDLLLLNQLGSNGLYRNRGDGTFEDVTGQTPELALADRVCVGAAFGDYDNDGDQDLYITSTRGGNVLFKNEGGGRFRDVTEEANVVCVAHSQTPAFFDYDNDGDLDLLVTNTARWTTDEVDARHKYYRGPDDMWSRFFDVRVREENVLFRNDGNGTFSNVSDESGLAGKGWSGDVALFDYDEDGDLDVFVTNMFGLSQLYRNSGHGTFEDVTRETLGTTSLGAIGAKAFDFDNDGRLDLFVGDMHSDMWIGTDESFLVEPRRKFATLFGPKGEGDRRAIDRDRHIADLLGADYERLVFGNTLFRNEGGGRFSEVSDSANMETFWPWGVAVGDFDNDGYVDAFLPSGMGYPYFYWPSALMMNRGDGTFIDRAASEGIEPPVNGFALPDSIGGRPAARSSRCAATADFDGDGRLDLIVNNFNDRPYYFRNQFASPHSIRFRLRGTRSNRDAVGAVVKLHCGDRVMVQQVQAAGGYLSQSSKVLHFGLGDIARVDRAEIRWPSGIRQTLPSPAVDTLVDVCETVDGPLTHASRAN